MNQPPGVSHAFDIYIHAAPDDIPATSDATQEINGVITPVLHLQPAQLTTPLGMTFEEALTHLDTQPRMFIEPDGSFVQRGEGWQIDGVLHDSPAGLTAIECRGATTQDAFEQLLAVAGWPDQPVVFQLTRAGTYLVETSFRRAFNL